MRTSQYWQPRLALYLAGGMVIAFSVVAVSIAQQKTPLSPKPRVKAAEKTEATEGESAPAVVIPKEEQPFWDSAQAYVDAYARRDGKALGELFTENAEFVSEDGSVSRGRDEIVALFNAVFESMPGILVDGIVIQRVRYVTDNVAIEEGRVTTSESVGATPVTSRYIAVHVKEKDGVWRINTLKDYAPDEGTAGDHLSELAWMVGEWVSEDSVSLVKADCAWSDDGNYLLRKFTVQIAGAPVMNGVQRIGWDPVRKEIRSWVFDSEGGYVEGSWKRNGDQWLVTSNGYSAQGETAASVTVFTVHDPERVTWQHRSLVLGNELQENIPPIVMVRRPPPPVVSE